MNESFQHCQRPTLAHVKNTRTLGVPSATEQLGAPPVICGSVSLAQPKDAHWHQPIMPYSIRPRISSTSRRPSDVSAASSGERPPSAGLGDRNHRNAFRRLAKTSPARAVMDKRASGMAGVRSEEVLITPRIHLNRLLRQPASLSETLSETKPARNLL
jgi:hypothetical protein